MLLKESRWTEGAELKVILKSCTKFCRIEEWFIEQWKHAKEAKSQIEKKGFKSVITTLKQDLTAKTLKVQCYTDCMLMF